MNKRVSKVKGFLREERNVNGFTLRNIKILRKSVVSAKNSEKYFKNGSALINDVLSIDY